MDYEKKYKNALEWARQVMNGETGFIRKEVEEVFPELKESEDEGIRKELIDYFSASHATDTFRGISWDRVVAWLEKQCEQTISNHIQMGKRYKCIATPRYTCFQKGNIYKPEDTFLCSLMNLCYDCFDLANEKEEQGKQDSLVFPRYKTGDILTDGKSKYNVLSWDYTEKGTPAYYMEGNGCKFSWGCKDADEKLTKIDEQKPAWSKEDEKIANSIWDSIDKSVLANYGVDEDKAFEWLSHIKDRVQLQPKQEWSEEDERIYNRICDIIHNAAFANYDVDEDGKELGEYAKIIGWLKSLRPQTTWKPSDEQIEALESATENCAYSEYQDCLRELIEQLKKLMEE